MKYFHLSVLGLVNVDGTSKLNLASNTNCKKLQNCNWALFASFHFSQNFCLSWLTGWWMSWWRDEPVFWQTCVIWTLVTDVAVLPFLSMFELLFSCQLQPSSAALKGKGYLATTPSYLLQLLSLFKIKQFLLEWHLQNCEILRIRLGLLWPSGVRWTCAGLGVLVAFYFAIIQWVVSSHNLGRFRACFSWS